MDPVVKADDKGGVRTSSMQIDSKVITNEQNAVLKNLIHLPFAYSRISTRKIN